MCESCNCTSKRESFNCPTCGKNLPRDLLVIIPHTEKHIIEVIKTKHPNWAESDGLCKKCYDYYKKEMNK